MKPSLFSLIVLLAEKGAIHHSVKITTISVAKELVISQQTASRWLNDLVFQKIAEKTPFGMRLTPSAKAELQKIKAILDEPKPFFFQGVVFSGVHDGAYYLSQLEYVEQFKKLLGFAPFPGTLNLRLASEADSLARRELRATPSLKVNGFRKNSHFFGPVYCFPALINEIVKGAIIIPERSHYSHDILEIIAPVRLRSRLRLKNGSRVTVKILPLSK